MAATAKARAGPGMPVVCDGPRVWGEDGLIHRGRNQWHVVFVHLTLRGKAEGGEDGGEEADAELGRGVLADDAWLLLGLVGWSADEPHPTHMKMIRSLPPLTWQTKRQERPNCGCCSRRVQSS